MLRKILALAGLLSLVAVAPALADGPDLKHPTWSFSGPFGQYDQEQLQRGFKVYREVCSQCHSLKLIAFHDLGEPGAPFWDPKYPNANDNPYVKAIAASFKVPDIDPDTGDPIQRVATSADSMPPPYANDIAAKATLGGSPPDMSLLAKAREGGPNYIYSIVTGYTQAPAGVVVPAGKYYDPYMPGGIIAMPPPLTAGKVTFDDGKPSTLDQEAQDIAAFLTWASDPHMEQRKQLGLAVMAYLIIFSGLLYASYRRIWRKVEH
jgi:ubiquinol-cytochrome c reductase cytochrome c1 subunit